ncbi:MAG: hypothetical protein ACI9DQ_001878 [Glaciecola sp.]|jgi:hypothetical protein
MYKQHSITDIEGDWGQKKSRNNFMLLDFFKLDREL